MSKTTTIGQLLAGYEDAAQQFPLMLAEFPDFDQSTLPTIPVSWEDTSWHNDMCPCFVTPDEFVVFIDFADVKLREFEEGPRFVVQKAGNEVICTDDWDAVLAAITSLREGDV